MKRILSLITITILFLAGCSVISEEAPVTQESEYGVYLSSEFETLPEDISYKTLVIDAQYFSAEEIEQLHKKNETVYSYINIGAIEDFRDYYDDYEDIFLGDYEHWEEEKYVDVSSQVWQDFLIEELAPQIKETGVDGFFIDNLDVYYEYHYEEIYEGITVILEGINKLGLDLMVNGADVYVSEYLRRNPDAESIIDAVNQETVFTAIDWDNEDFTESTEEDRSYYLQYLSEAEKAGIAVYLLEYTIDPDLSEEIAKRCHELDYTYYISDSIELD